jgi:hypothetical protein
MIVSEMQYCVIKVTGWAGSCVRQTEEVARVWVDTDVPETRHRQIAQEHGGDFLRPMSTTATFAEVVRSRVV